MSSIPRGRAIGIIVLALLPSLLLAMGVGWPNTLLLLVGLVTAPFTLFLRDRPPVFAGLLAAIATATVWGLGTAPFECSVSVQEGRVGIATYTCPRLLLPDIDHIPELTDTAVTYLGMWPVAIGVGGAASVIVNRRMRKKHPLVLPPPPPPGGGGT